MQQFVRSIDIKDAFKMKIELLQNEFSRKKDLLEANVLAKETEIKELEQIGSVERDVISIAFAKGNLSILSGILAIIFMGIYSYANADGIIHPEQVIFDLFFFGIIIYGFIQRKKGKVIQVELERKMLTVSNQITKLRVEIKDINEKIRLENLKLHEDISRQEDIFQQHMLNQQDLLDQEAKAINHLENPTISATKECPMCAESIKAKAKVCRYCSYKFVDVYS
jgi:hypothetical protein